MIEAKKDELHEEVNLKELPQYPPCFSWGFIKHKEEKVWLMAVPFFILS
jgi:hypothetical protein